MFTFVPDQRESLITLMNTEERIRKQKELIEEIGRHFDKQGFQPIAGRIMGLLMVLDKEQFTFDEIVEELQISKSSASNALRNLEIRDVIEYVTHPGDRKRYFQVKRSDGFAVMQDMENKMQQMVTLFNYILDLKADKDSKNCQYYKDMVSVVDLIRKKMDEVKTEYKNNKDK